MTSSNGAVTSPQVSGRDRRFHSRGRLTANDDDALTGFVSGDHLRGGATFHFITEPYFDPQVVYTSFR
jgi:hypothetical protein